MFTLAMTIGVGLVLLSQPGGGQTARDHQREWNEIQSHQRATQASYGRPEFQPDAVPPDNAALWYGLLPKSSERLVGGPGPRFDWTVFDYDTERYGLHPAPGLDGNPSEEQFKREADRLMFVNAPAVDLFVRASRIKGCDFEAAAHHWAAEEDSLRYPNVTLGSFSRVVLLDARSQWVAGDRRLALERIAAVLRCGHHIARFEGTGPISALGRTRWAMDEALLAIKEWPEPGPSERDGRELAEAVKAIDPADPCGVAEAWRRDSLRFAQELIAEAAEHGTGPKMGERVRRECLIIRRDDVPASMMDNMPYLVHDGPLPLESMTAAQLEAAVHEALPRLERVYQLMTQGGTGAEIREESQAAMHDPEFIEPLLLVNAHGLAEMMHRWRVTREELLRAIGQSPREQ